MNSVIDGSETSSLNALQENPVVNSQQKERGFKEGQQDNSTNQPENEGKNQPSLDNINTNVTNQNNAVTNKDDNSLNDIAFNQQNGGGDDDDDDNDPEIETPDHDTGPTIEKIPTMSNK